MGLFTTACYNDDRIQILVQSITNINLTTARCYFVESLNVIQNSLMICTLTLALSAYSAMSLMFIIFEQTHYFNNRSNFPTITLINILITFIGMMKKRGLLLSTLRAPTNLPCIQRGQIFNSYIYQGMQKLFKMYSPSRTMSRMLSSNVLTLLITYR